VLSSLHSPQQHGRTTVTARMPAFTVGRVHVLR